MSNTEESEAGEKAKDQKQTQVVNESGNTGVADQSGEDEVDSKNFLEVMFSGLAISRPSSSKPSSKYSPAFNMNHKRRGICVIFNQVRFDPRLELSERSGSDIDAANLRERFGALGFEAQIYNDYTSTAIRSVLDNISRQNHNDEDCFVCCFLSHGEDDEVLYAFDGALRVPDLLAPFKGNVCKSLAGKPKLFFIQACRGTKLDHGVTVDVTDGGGDVTDSRELRIPSEADFLIAYSGVPGYYCWRNAARGSWFVQSLCEVMRKFADKVDLLTMMTLVNAKVAYDFESQLDNVHMKNKKQVPCIVSMLTKQVWFNHQSSITVPLS